MQTLSTTFLTPQEQQAVTAAVQQAEKQTSGEIVPMIASASHHYPLAAVRGGTFLALPLALLATALLGSHLWLGDQNMYLFVAFFLLFYLPFRMLVDRSPRLKRLFLSGREVEEEVEEAAITAFFSEGLYRTRQQNGILLFVSVLERKVWILGDRGINERIDPHGWDAIVDELSAGIKDGRQGEALCLAIDRVGEMLRTHFPYQRNDTDELHNLIIR